MTPFLQQLQPGGVGVMAAPLLSVALLSLTIGVWVVVRERGRQVSLSFLATTLALALYLGGFAFMAVAPSPEVAHQWGKFAYLGVPFIVPGIYQFSVDLLGLRRLRRPVVRAAWAVGGVYAALALTTDALVPGVLATRWGYVTRINYWSIPFLLSSMALLAVVIRDYTRVYSEADRVQRARIRWFAIPLAIASLGFVDYLPSFGVPLPPVGFAFFPVFLLSAAWTVERYHLPDLTPAFAAEQIIATMADGLLVCETTGRIALANAAAERLLGHRPAELQGLQLAAVFGPHQADSLVRSTLVERETHLFTRRGQRVDVSVSTGRIHDRAGRVMGIVVVARDVRERKRAAAEIERREQRFRALTENALDTITILDANGRITYQSPAVRQLGYDPEEDVGRDIFERVHPEDVARLGEAFRAVVEHPDARREAEARIRDGSGRYRTFVLRARNLLHHSAVCGVVVNGRDTTEERQLEAQLQQAQKMEAIGRLAGGVAHDFNNILTAIQGNVALLAEAVPADSPLAAELDEVRRGAERAARLTDQLLAFSRRQVVRPELLDLEDVVRELRSMLERLIGEDIRLQTPEGPDCGLVRADRVQVEQALLNLVVNARDAMAAGGRIEITTAPADLDEEAAARLDGGVPAGAYAVLTVSDDGHGMDDVTRARIFEPFFTTKGPGQGTGLGLSTVYGTVRQAGGFVTVESQPQKGTRFAIYLPRVDREGAEETGPTEAVPGAASSSGDRTRAAPGPGAAPDGAVEGRTVLVVEDEAPVRSLMRKILGRNGYHVLEAEDGPSALEKAAAYEGRIHLLVTDLVMPGMTGREVAERLMAARPGLRTIFVSGYTADEVVRRGIVAGEHAFLAKPFTPSELVARVGEALEGARSQAWCPDPEVR